MRKLKFHEHKLLRKVDFLQWKKDQQLREVAVIRRYHIQNRDDYHKYNKLVGLVQKLLSRMKKLDPKDKFRADMADQLLLKLFQMGLISSQSSLGAVEKLNASSFARRRLPVVMVRLKMAERVSDAVKFIEQGHVRIGPEVVVDPAMLVTRSMEDFVTWSAQSKIKRVVQKYNDKVDDFDLLQS